MNSKLLYTFLAALLAMIAWVWQSTAAQTYGKLSEIEKSLTELKLEVVKIQASMMTEDRVREIVHIEIQGRKP